MNSTEKVLLGISITTSITFATFRGLQIDGLHYALITAYMGLMILSLYYLIKLDYLV